MKNFSRKEMFIVILAVFVFLVLSSIVIFKREWLDNLIFGPAPYEAKIELEDDSIGLDTEEEIHLEVPFVSLNIVSDGEGANVVFNLEEELALTGFELVFSKDEGLEISDFSCNSPFECIFVEIEDTKLSASGLIPVTSVEPLQAGQRSVGVINYTGSGTLTLIPEESTIVDLDFVEYNLLDYDTLNFEL